MVMVEIPRIKRLIAKVEFGPGCWEWTGSLSDYGYGRIRRGHGRKGNMGAHVAMWEFINGAVPPGLELDHLCRNPKCVRPDHLEPVTHYQVGRSSSRRCRECLREYDRKRGAKRG